MIRFHVVMIITVVLMAAVSGELSASIDTADSRISAVTVYTDRAKVQRLVEMTFDEGIRQVVFTDLPISIDIASFRASAEGMYGLTILGLTHGTEEHFETPREEAAGLERQIQTLNRDSVTMLEDRLRVLQSQKELLRRMSKEKAEKAAEDVGIGGGDLAAWERAYEFLGRRLTVVNDSIRTTTFQLEDLKRRMELLNRKLRSIQSQRATVTRTVTVDIEADRPGDATVSLDYIVPGATWRPMYDARWNDTDNRVELAMLTEVSQHSGEDWSDVNLTLSTVQPSSGIGPGRPMPWYLATSAVRSTPISGSKGKIHGAVKDRMTGEPVIGASILVVGTTRGAQTDVDGAYTIFGVDPGAYTLRVSHMQYRTVEIIGVTVQAGLAMEQSLMMEQSLVETEAQVVVGQRDRQEMREVANQVIRRPATVVDTLLSQVAGVMTNEQGQVFIRGTRTGEGSFIVDGVPLDEPLLGSGQAHYAYASMNRGAVARNFVVTRKQTVASDSRAVRCPLGTWVFDGELSLICRPRQHDGVFREVAQINTAGTPLLPGGLHLFAGASYLGAGRLSRVIVDGERFELPFGASQEVTVKRSIVQPKTELDGDKVREKETIRIRLTNHAASARTVTIQEAMPRSRDKAIETDVRHVAPEPDNTDECGVAKWTMTIPAGETKTIEYRYEIKYPRGMKIQGL